VRDETSMILKALDKLARLNMTKTVRID